MKNINTIEYWDNRFNTDWESMLGEEQTRFFANVAMDLMPNWLKDEIQNEKLTICDFGCAMGQAVDYLHNTLQTEVSGIDFSESAIAKAKKIYPQYSFTKSDIVNDYNNQLKFDVGYISNVLEHITDPWVKISHPPLRY